MSAHRGSSRRFGARGLELLLHLYPRRFRERHADELRWAFEEAWRERPSGGTPVGTAWWLVRDLVASAVRARWSELTSRTRVPSLPQRRERVTVIGILGYEIRHSLRTLFRNPGFACVTVLTLGLGIGATTAIFGVVETVLLRPLPYEESGEIVWVENRYLPSGDVGSVSYPEYWEYRQETAAIRVMAAFSFDSSNLTGLDTPIRVQGLRVSPSFFDVLRMPIAIGRGFVAEEEAPGGPAVVVISHRLWRTALGGRPDIIGRTIVLDGEALAVVGVVGAEHSSLASHVSPGRTSDFWTPVVLDPTRFDASMLAVHNLRVIGRLADGVDPASAPQAMTAALGRLEARFPDADGGREREIAVTRLAEKVTGDIGTTLGLLLAAVALVLAVACVNVANVLLARGEVRVSDASVHAALGASRARLVLHGLVESGLIGVAGGVLGIILAIWAQRTLVGLAPSDLPRLDEIGLNATVFLFCAGISIAAGLLAGLLPSLRLRSGDVSDALRSAGRGGLSGSRAMLKRVLVVGQVAAAVVIASAAGLLGRTLVELRAVDPGFRADDVLVVDVNATTARYGTLESVQSFYRTLLDRVEAVPGVDAAAASWQTPLQAGMSDWPIRTNAEEAEWIGADPNLVTNRYFETMGIRLLDGRLFDASDLDRAEGALIVSETAARRMFPDGQAVGKVANIDFDSVVWREIVGVVADVRGRGLGSEPQPQTYVSMAQVPFGPNPSLTLTVKTSLPEESFRPALIDIMRGIDPDVPIGPVLAMRDQVSVSMGRERFLAIILGVFAATALLLGAIGVYGLLAYDVSRQRREIGLRIALGAEPRRVLARVVGRAVALASIGVVVGLLGSVATTRLLEGFLYGVATTDAGTLAGVGLVVLAVATLASLTPARRAAGVDPLAALRED